MMPQSFFFWTNWNPRNPPQACFTFFSLLYADLFNIKRVSPSLLMPRLPDQTYHLYVSTFKVSCSLRFPSHFTESPPPGRKHILAEAP